MKSRKTKSIIFITICMLTLNYKCYGYFTKAQVKFSPNKISTWIWNTGVFNQDLRTNNTPGFQWPAGSGKFAIFTSGISLGAYVNGKLRLATASYSGEYQPGYIIDSAGVPKFRTDERFRLYSVRYNDTQNNNPDLAKWKDMVPLGAPYDDINNNKIYEPGIDKPGMPGAIQTVFVCLTDGDPNTHSSSEGFSGGTRPLNAEVRLTAWGYDLDPISSVQYFNWTIINKNDSAWNGLFTGICSDPDLGDATDDYIGCDTSLQLAFSYNADSSDGTGTGVSYGMNPPAVGQIFLRGLILKNNNLTDTLKTTSSVYISGGGSEVCTTDPSGSPLQAYNFMKGKKKDGTPWLNPLSFPYNITKFCYSGNPEDSTGWVEKKGRIENCNGVVTGTVIPSPPGDRRIIFSTGSDFLTVNPGDTQKIVIAQLIGKGSSNLNAVTKLKETAALARNVYYRIVEGFETYYDVTPPALPTQYFLHQNYPNPFNPVTTIKYEMKKLWRVKIQVYDTRGELINILVNEDKPQGVYEVQFDASKLPSGIYFIKMTSGGGFEDSKKMVVIK